MMQFSVPRPRFALHITTEKTSAKPAPTPSAAKSIGELFAEEILPHLRSCKNFSLDRGTSNLPQALTQCLSVQEHRGLAWRYLAETGPNNLTPPQLHALVAALLTHIDTDKDACITSLTAVIEHAVRRRDYRLYQAFGEAILTMSERSSQPLNPFHTVLLGAPFAQLSVYNAGREKWSQPWIEIFTKAGHEPLHGALMNVVNHHVRNGDTCLYDHLLTVLCNANSKFTTLMLAESLNPSPVLTAESVRLRPSTGSVLRGFIRHTTQILPFSAGMTFIIHGASAVFSWHTIAYAAVAGGIHSTFLLKHLHTMMQLDIQKERSFIRSTAFMHYAESVYRKLSVFRDKDSDKTEILKLMESHPAYASKIGQWQAEQDSGKA
jgi:hypothetical protein